MKRILFVVALIAVLSCNAISDAAEPPIAAKCEEGDCGPFRKLGTAIDWADNAKQAAQLARQQNKLVFLIQVSGNFAREEFT